MSSTDTNGSLRETQSGSGPSDNLADLQRSKEDGNNSDDKDEEATTSYKAQQMTTRFLQLLSNASNETLGACLVGLSAVTYLVLGRVGLVLIGIVSGIVLHATWEDYIQNGADEKVRRAEAKRRKEVGLDVAARVLDWRGNTRHEPTRGQGGGEDTAAQALMKKDLNFGSFQSATSTALTRLTDAVIQDYVKWWYGPLLPLDVSFPSACRETLTAFLLSISSHLSRRRPADTFLNFLTNSSSVVIVFLHEFSNAVTSAGTLSMESEDAVNAYLESNPDSSLANVLDLDQQKSKLKVVAEEVLRSFLDAKAYNCEPVKSFLQEVLAGLVLDMTVDSCSKPEWINGWIIYLLEEVNSELVTVIDAGVSGSAAPDISKTIEQTPMEASSLVDDKNVDSPSRASYDASHKRTVSRAEEAMEEAMLEAKRLSDLIAAEDAKKEQSGDASMTSSITTTGSATPTSSQEDAVAPTGTPSMSSATDTAVPAVATSDVSDTVSSFTSFDQLVNTQQPTALNAGALTAQPSGIPPLTLHKASISIFDDSQPGEKGTIRSKPTVDYLLQIEPASSQHPGWMIARKYADFETLHEVLRRIAVIAGVPTFSERHTAIPSWKGQSKVSLRGDLEKYIQDALSYERLAESEGMKRFLEKDQGLGRGSPNANKGGFAFPTPAAFETMGKGMLDVLASAPKGAAGGGKAILGGVSGVFGQVGSLGQKKQSSTKSNGQAVKASDPSNFESSKGSAQVSNASRPRDSVDIPRQSLTMGRTSMQLQDSPSRQSYDLPDMQLRQNGAIHIDSPDIPVRPSSDSLRLSEPNSRPARKSGDELRLPPPPSEIPDDYATIKGSSRRSESGNAQRVLQPVASAPTDREVPSLESTSSQPTEKGRDPVPSKIRDTSPMTEQETQVAVELFFAVVNELFTLSSAWNIRRTLLNAAKGFLLRPGNQNLEAIRVLIQDTIIDANTSDIGLAFHLGKIRENALPTEEELKAWPPPPSEEEKTRMRQKARKLLVEKGMPQALTSVMGAAASGEALGKVFDCLQIQKVARGLIFALMLQALRAITQ